MNKNEELVGGATIAELETMLDLFKKANGVGTLANTKSITQMMILDFKRKTQSRVYKEMESIVESWEGRKPFQRYNLNIAMDLKRTIMLDVMEYLNTSFDGCEDKLSKETTQDYIKGLLEPYTCRYVDISK